MRADRARTAAGLIAHPFGLRYIATRYGVVFFTHQLGSFMGLWLGGRIGDVYGDYALVGWVGLGKCARRRRNWAA